MRGAPVPPVGEKRSGDRKRETRGNIANGLSADYLFDDCSTSGFSM